MLAQFYLERVGTADDTFTRLFLSGEVTYSNLYFSTPRGRAAPLPLSARSCKYASGFLMDTDKHGVVDALLPTFAWQRAEGSGATPPVDRCNDCEAPLERFAGFYESLGESRRTVHIEDLSHLVTRSATDDVLQTAERGLLYTLEVLDPTAAGYMPASGLVTCANREAAALVRQHVLEPAFEATQTSFFIGTARSRGLGKIVTAGQPLNPFEPATTSPNLAERLQIFNATITALGVNDNRTYFSLTLHADAIIQDEFCRCHSTIPAALLAWEMGLKAHQLQLQTYFTETHVVTGWNAALRAPKTDALAIRMGATFLYAATGIAEQTLLDQLLAIETQALGARRTEGFGRVKVCDAFHVEARKEPI
jgi:CRISPR-associated protein Csx10